jgi:hypothetical protein
MAYVLRNGKYLIADTIMPEDIQVTKKPGELYSWLNGEWVYDIETFKQNKIQELSDACTDDIFHGLCSKAYDGVNEKHYDCEFTDQSRIAGLVSIAQMRVLGFSDEPLKWKAHGELVCYEWTPQSILMLGIDVKKHIESRTDKFYILREQVINSLSKDEIESII